MPIVRIIEYTAVVDPKFSLEHATDIKLVLPVWASPIPNPNMATVMSTPTWDEQKIERERSPTNEIIIPDDEGDALSSPHLAQLSGDRYGDRSSKCVCREDPCQVR